MHCAPAHTRWHQLALVGLAATTAIVLATFNDYGITWDAHYHMANGKHVLAYYTSLFEDRSVLTYHNLYLYGGAFDGIVALANLVSPLGEYETSHLLNALVGVLGLVGCWKLVEALAGPRAAFLAALLLLLTPPWYGHIFNNPKDIPFATAMTWSLYYMVRVGDALPVVPIRLAMKLGVALGLTMGMRVGGVLGFAYFAAVIATYLFVRWRAHVGAARIAAEAGRIGLRTLLPVAAIAFAVMLVCWPWAQQDPLGNPVKALLLFSNIPWDINVLFEGRLVNSLRLPADYLPVYFLVKLPEVVLILLLLAVPTAIGTVLVRRARAVQVVRPGYVLLFLAIAFPFVYFVAKRPVTFDCIRHFLFVIPPIAAAAGIAADHLLDADSLLTRRVAAGALAIGIAWSAVSMVRLHPHEYVYYNELVGGVKGAEDKFELDYWGNSYAEAVEELVKFLERENAGRPPKPYRVAVCSSGVSAAYFFPPYLSLATEDSEVDFYISVTRLDCDDAYKGKEIIKVEREGALLSVVKDRRQLRIEHPEQMRVARPADIRIHPGAYPDDIH